MPSETIRVLARTNRVRQKLNRRLKANPRTEHLEVMTYHGAKGLESNYCVLVGDCVYQETSPIRNLAYRLAGFPQSYDEAQRDEALRLAYVALTRAENGECLVCRTEGRGSIQSGGMLLMR